MTETVIYIMIGLALIVAGGNAFVDSSIAISEKLRIPKFVIGATIVSIATTLPELTVSVLSTLSGKVELAAGNAIGSVVVNTGFILAIALIASKRPVSLGEEELHAEKSGDRPPDRHVLKSAILIVAELITLCFSVTGKLTAIAAIPLIVACIAFLGLNLRDGLNAATNEATSGASVLGSAVRFVLGIAGLIVGSRLLVERGSELAASLGVPDGVIAATIVALGTSLPELVTSVTAMIKGQGSLSLGNILGANIMDIAFIMPICALIGGGLAIRTQTLLLDLPMCVALSVIAFLPKGKERIRGVALLCLYAVYIALLLTFFT